MRVEDRGICFERNPSKWGVGTTDLGREFGAECVRNQMRHFEIQ